MHTWWKGSPKIATKKASFNGRLLIVRGAIFVFMIWLLMGCGAHHDPRPGSGFESIDPDKKLKIGTYPWLAVNVFEPHCNRCHSEATPKNQFVDTSSYEGLVIAARDPKITIPGDPENSLLYKSVLTGEMPKKGNRLSDDMIRAIHDWIKSGANKL